MTAPHSPVRFLPPHGTSAEAESPSRPAVLYSPHPLWFHGITIPAGRHEHRSVTLDDAQEAQVVALIGDGFCTEEIADRFGVPFVTVAEVAYRRQMPVAASGDPRTLPGTRALWRAAWRAEGGV